MFECKWDRANERIKHNEDIVKAIYKAEIFEYESGEIDIVYECDKKNNKECNKKSCYKDCCSHTLNKKYIKNYK